MADASGGPPPAPSRLAGTRRGLSLVLGLVMTGIGAYVALRPLWDRVPVTGSRWTDWAFAFFFLLRGVLYLRSLRRPA